ncbi:MAG: M48 family metallopeptidase [Spirochaetales bacterium]|nr:M48 family metallopeptidase [Spirochaetales bacterium]
MGVYGAGRDRRASRIEALAVGGLEARVERKRIKTLRLRVVPPEGDVLVSAPEGLPLGEIRRFVESRLAWIKRHREAVRARSAASPADPISCGRLRLWGEQLGLEIAEGPGRARVELAGETLTLRVRPGSSDKARAALLDAWLAAALLERALPLVEAWSRKLGVKPGPVRPRRMKTRWGSCSVRTGAIRLSLELTSKPPSCLEYVVVHELAHLLEPGHGPRFHAIIERVLPDWKERKAALCGPART